MNNTGKRCNYVAACYARLSVDDEQDGTSVSIETQKKILEDYCKQNNIAIYDFYCDDGYTGTNFNRPDFKRMISDADKKRFNMVVVKDLSRFGRDYIGTGHYIETYFPQAQIRFVAIGDNFDSSINNNDIDFIVPMKNLFNQFYPADCSRKVRQAFKAKAARGEFIGTYAPYGYRKDKNDKHLLVIDENIAPIVIRIFTLIAYHGYGYTKIAKTFTNEKILTPYATQMKYENKPCDKNPYDWNLGSISAIVHNEIYIGNLVSGKKETISFKNRKVVKKNREDCIVVENAFPQIISNELWHDAHKRIKERKRDNSNDGFNIFAGLIRCDRCGKVLGISGRKDSRPYYCCETYKKKGKDVCTSHYTLYEDIYNTVFNSVKSIIEYVMSNQDGFELKVMSAITNDIQNQKTVRQTIEELESQITRINERYDQMYQDRLDGVISLEKFKSLVKGDEERVEQIREEIKKLKEQELSVKEQEKQMKSFVERIHEIGDIKELDSIILNTLIDKIVIGERHLVNGKYEQEIKIYYKFGNPYLLL